MNYDWIIIGGGIHGVHIAARLLAHANIRPESLAIVDPASSLLSRWHALSTMTGMRYLRSPSVHHLDLDPWSLLKYAGDPADRPVGLFAPPYDRPSLNLFNRHCEQVIRDHALDERHISARALSCDVSARGLHLTLDHNRTLDAEQMVLALGASEQPYWPSWAVEPGTTTPIQHIFDPRGAEIPQSPQKLTVVGGGISAAQFALKLLDCGHEVQLITRHPLREHQFDSDPGWLGPKHMTRFRRERSMVRRREIIRAARHRGSLPPDVLTAIQERRNDPRFELIQGRIQSIDDEQGILQLDIGPTQPSQGIYLATGFSTQRPGGTLVDGLVRAAKLPCAPCGYPLVGPDLAWHERIYLSGPLAELELGPTARNIAGARRAAERIIKRAQSTPSLSLVAADRVEHDLPAPSRAKIDVGTQAQDLAKLAGREEQSG